MHSFTAEKIQCVDCCHNFHPDQTEAHKQACRKAECKTCTFRGTKKNMARHERAHAYEALRADSQPNLPSGPAVRTRSKPTLPDATADSAKRNRRRKATDPISESDETRHICDVCQTQFSRRDNLSAHVKIHNKRPRDIACSVCSQTFHERSSLRQHMTTHQHRFRCTQCADRSFARSSELRAHIHSRHTPISDLTQYLCQQCSPSRQLLTLSGFRRHVRVQHAS